MTAQAQLEEGAAYLRGGDNPAGAAVLITPSDSTELAVRALRVYVPSGTGPKAIKITGLTQVDGEAVTLTYPDGVTIDPIGVKKVWATGTDSGVTIHGYKA